MDELDQTTTRYLLGELPEQEQAAFEKRYFSDSQVFNQVLQVESELVDAYARGQLPSEMRERFEQFYLAHPSRRERVKFATALTDRIDQREESSTRVEQPALHISWWQRLLTSFGGQRPRLRLSMALATVLIILAAAWIFVTSRRQHQQREAAQVQSQQDNQERRNQEQTAQQQPQRQPQQIPQLSPSPTTNFTRPIAFVTLTAGGVRGTGNSETPTLVTSHDTAQAQILLKLKDDSYPHYRVSLQKIGGAEIFTQANIRPRNTKAGASFVFTVAVSQLSSGDYALTLIGISPSGELDNLSKSLFRVEKR